MKITKSQLKRIIKEELESVVSEKQKDPHRDALMALNNLIFTIEQLKSNNKFPQSLEDYHNILDSIERETRSWAAGRGGD
tara:strand:- start:290 stop:529 length:240 start_codon:yes stop_codon:yes gene_type:complete